MIVDFEGHPGQMTSERRIKRLVLLDVTGMLCSFRYAADTALARQLRTGPAGAGPAGETRPRGPAAGGFGSAWRFSRVTSARSGDRVLLPAADETLQALLEVFLLHRMLDELDDHLVTEPALVRPACEGILELLQPQQKR